MPKRNVVLADHRTERGDHTRLKALRRAVQVGIDDLGAGRRKDFASFTDLEVYLRGKADRVLAKLRASRNRR